MSVFSIILSRMIHAYFIMNHKITFLRASTYSPSLEVFYINLSFAENLKLPSKKGICVSEDNMGPLKFIIETRSIMYLYYSTLEFLETITVK